VTAYTVYVTPSAWREIKDLPGNMRQRVKRAIDALADEPHPSNSQALRMPADLNYNVWRLRLDNWRVVYAVTEEDRAIDVLAVRKRPPYDYRGLEKILAEIR
jgi:mRNA interferase RelE/StbE